jgi:hypothetical protein
VLKRVIRLFALPAYDTAGPWGDESDRAQKWSDSP